MMETFTQIIFPPKPKPIIVEAVKETGMIVYKSENGSRYVPDTIYCSTKCGMVLLVNCVRCDHPTESLETILTTGMGC
jgi:hypothetical protein